MSCNACSKSLDTDTYLVCRHCNKCFHYRCLNMNSRQFLSLTNKYKEAWGCPECTYITRRSKPNINTPVRQTQVPEADHEESMNMSYEHSASMPLIQPVSAASTITSTEEISIDKISNLLEHKLNESLSYFMDNFRTVLKDDVKELVRCEIESIINKFGNELTATTNRITEEQMALKAEVEAKANIIKNLEKNNLSLQADINALKQRFYSIDKTSRSYNLELQAIPENRNENVLAIFRKLCDVVNIKIEDSQIHSCRRVFKFNPSSPRPRNILITLNSPRLRDEIISAAHRFNKKHSDNPLNTNHLGIGGESYAVFISEHLSPELKSLHAAARIAARKSKYKYVWVKYGRIFVRKDDGCNCIQINKIECLDKIK